MTKYLVTYYSLSDCTDRQTVLADTEDEAIVLAKEADEGFDKLVSIAVVES